MPRLRKIPGRSKLLDICFAGMLIAILQRLALVRGAAAWSSHRFFATVDSILGGAFMGTMGGCNSVYGIFVVYCHVVNATAAEYFWAFLLLRGYPSLVVVSYAHLWAAWDIRQYCARSVVTGSLRFARGWAILTFHGSLYMLTTSFCFRFESRWSSCGGTGRVCLVRHSLQPGSRGPPTQKPSSPRPLSCGGVG